MTLTFLLLKWALLLYCHVFFTFCSPGEGSRTRTQTFQCSFQQGFSSCRHRRGYSYSLRKIVYHFLMQTQIIGRCRWSTWMTDYYYYWYEKRFIWRIERLEVLTPKNAMQKESKTNLWSRYATQLWPEFESMLYAAIMRNETLGWCWAILYTFN